MKADMNEMVKRLGRGKAEAMMRECEEKNISVVEFLLEVFNGYGAEPLFDTLYNLCEKYNLPALGEDDIEEGYDDYYKDEDYDYRAWKAFQYRLMDTRRKS